MAEGVSRLAEIAFALVKSDPDIPERYCGVNSIDKMVKNSYYSGLLDKCRFWEAKIDELTVGYCSYYFTDIQLPDEEYSSGFRDNRVTVMYIRYIAVKEKYQRHGIGNYMLSFLCRAAIQHRQFVPFRMIVIDAFEHLQPWYESKGFEPFYEANQEDYGLIHMKMDLQDRSEIDRYCDRE